MIQLTSWVATAGLVFYVIKLSGASTPVLAAYAVAALLLRWWLVKRVDTVHQTNADNARRVAQARQFAIRKEQLMGKYGNAWVVDAILRGEIWKGATSEMLGDSWGEPHEIKRAGDSETWCYGRVGQNRYRHRVTVRGGAVTTWTNKN